MIHNRKNDNQEMAEKEKEIMIEINQMIIESMKEFDNNRSFEFINDHISMSGEIEIRISDNIYFEEIEYFNNNSDYEIFNVNDNKYNSIIRIDCDYHKNID